MSVHPTRQYFRTEARKDAASGKTLGIKTMLGTAGKLGPDKIVRCFSRSLAGSCCSKRVDGSIIATDVCRASCYHHQMASGRPTVSGRLIKNNTIARRDDFHLLLTGAIMDSGVEYFRMHDVGDFAEHRDIKNVVRAAQMLPHVHFWAYTRSWRFADMAPLGLLDLHKLPNFDLLLSLDRMTGIPQGALAKLPFAWFADTDGDPPPVPCRVVFRGTAEKNPAITEMRQEAKSSGFALPQFGRNVVAARSLSGNPVCPHETGYEIKASYKDCVSCQLCFVKLGHSRLRE